MLYPEVFSQSNGTYDLDGLLDLLSSTADGAHVCYVTSQLISHGFIFEGHDNPEHPLRWSLNQMGVPVGKLLSQTATELIHIRPVEGVDARPFLDAFSNYGSSAGEEGQLVLVLSRDYLSPAATEEVQKVLRSGRDCIPAGYIGTTFCIGPKFGEDRTNACLKCCRDRTARHRKARTESVDSGTLNVAVAGLAALQLVGAALAAPGSLFPDHLLAFDPITGKSEWCWSPCRSVCACCPPQNTPSPHRVIITPSGTRSVSDGEMQRRLEKNVNNFTGVVYDVKSEYPHGRNGIHVASAKHIFPTLLCSQHTERGGGQNASGGKGDTESAAQLSAIAEACERVCGMPLESRQAVFGSLNELNDAIHPNLVMQFSEAQYEKRDDINSSNNPHTMVPHRFDADRRMRWSIYSDLTSENSTALLPESLSFYQSQDGSDDITCMSDSNGCAAGGSIEEAAFQGFCELIERDAVGIWWYNKIRMPAVAIDTFGLPHLERLQEYYCDRHRRMWVLDLTADLGVPVFAAVSCDDDGGRVSLGFGSHAIPQIAVSRAIAEMHQFEPLLGERPDPANLEMMPATIREWFADTRIEDVSFLTPNTDSPVTTADKWKTPTFTTTDDYMQFGIDVARRANSRFLLLDQSRRDIELKVVRVVIPGLRHFWRRFAPGRLFDVPVDMGWQSKPTREGDLNERTVFF